MKYKDLKIKCNLAIYANQRTSVELETELYVWDLQQLIFGELTENIGVLTRNDIALCDSDIQEYLFSKDGNFAEHITNEELTEETIENDPAGFMKFLKGVSEVKLDDDIWETYE